MINVLEDLTSTINPDVKQEPMCFRKVNDSRTVGREAHPGVKPGGTPWSIQREVTRAQPAWHSG